MNEQAGESVKVALITGAGGGLGSALCQCYLQAGWQVVATDLDVAPLEKLGKHAALTCLPLDVTSSDACHAVAAQIEQRFRRLDVLINNAGIMSYFPVIESDPESVIRHFQINSFSALRTTHACLDLLVNSRGRVLNISSESWRLRTGFMAYQSSKLCLEGLSDVMRRELQHLGVQLCTVRPGAIDTQLFHAMTSIVNPLPHGRLAGVFQRFADTLQRHPPMRLSSTQQVAERVYRASISRTMRPHVEMNNMWSLKVMSWLPAAWTDRIFHRLLSDRTARNGAD